MHTCTCSDLWKARASTICLQRSWALPGSIRGLRGEQENTRAKKTKIELSSSPKIPHVVSKMLQGSSSNYFCQLCQNFSPPATPSPPPLHRREPKACSTERRGGERSGLDAQLKHVMRMESNTLWPDRYTRTDVSDTWHARGSSQGFPLKHAHTRLFTLARYTRPHTRLRHALCYDKQGPSSVCVRDTGAIGGVGDTEEEEKAWWGNYFSDYFSLTATLKICFFLNYWSPAAINETNRGTILEFHTAWHHLNTTWRKWYQAGVDGGVRTTPVRLGGKQWFR